MKTTIFVIDAAELSRVSPKSAPGAKDPEKGSLEEKNGYHPLKGYPQKPSQNEVIGFGPFEIFENEEMVQENAGASKELQRTILASVGTFTWVLTPTTPSMRLGELTFAFQDMENPENQLVLLFPVSTPPESIGTLEAILEEVTEYRELIVEEDAVSDDRQNAESIAGQALDQQMGDLYSSKSAKAVAKIATATASGITSSALWAADAMGRASQRFVAASEPTQKPVKLPFGMKSVLHLGAKSAKWTAKTLNKAGDGIGWAGSKTASGIMKMTGLQNPPEGTHRATLRQTTSAAAVGASHIWQTLEEAGYLVVTSARDNVANVTKHKYGEDAAEAAKHSMNAAVYTVDAATALSPRAVARRAAKQTAKGFLKQMQ